MVEVADEYSFSIEKCEEDGCDIFEFDVRLHPMRVVSVRRIREPAQRFFDGWQVTSRLGGALVGFGICPAGRTVTNATYVDPDTQLTQVAPARRGPFVAVVRRMARADLLRWPAAMR